MHSCASRIRWKWEYTLEPLRLHSACVHTRILLLLLFHSLSLSCVSQRIGTRACSLRPGTRTSNRRINNPSFTCCLCPELCLQHPFEGMIVEIAWNGSFLYLFQEMEISRVLMMMIISCLRWREENLLWFIMDLIGLFCEKLSIEVCFLDENYEDRRFWFLSREIVISLQKYGVKILCLLPSFNA